MTTKGMYVKTKNGNVAHVLADSKMSLETEMAIHKMIDLVASKEEDHIPCHSCQGSGCPTCNGFGYYIN